MQGNSNGVCWGRSSGWLHEEGPGGAPHAADRASKDRVEAPMCERLVEFGKVYGQSCGRLVRKE